MLNARIKKYIFYQFYQYTHISKRLTLLKIKYALICLLHQDNSTLCHSIPSAIYRINWITKHNVSCPKQDTNQIFLKSIPTIATH